MSGITIYPTPIATTTISGTVETQDLDQKTTQNNILKQLRKINMYNSQLANFEIKDKEVE